VRTPRYRCSACGNLTRFDVTTTRTTRAFHHYTVGGELQVEEEEVLAETVDAVSCRWCGNGRSVGELPAEEDRDEESELSAAADGPDSGTPGSAAPSTRQGAP